MLIAFGEQNISLEQDNGTFDCPSCHGAQPYSHQQTQSYFSIFFIRTFKLPLKTDVVVCNHCHSCFNPKIIQLPADFQTAIDKSILLRALCYLIVGYGDTQHSRQRLVEIYCDHTKTTIDDALVSQEIIEITSGNSPTLLFLNTNKLFLSHQAKQIVILASYQLAKQSCLMEFEDRVRINTIAANLDIEIREVNYLIASLK